MACKAVHHEQRKKETDRERDSALLTAAESRLGYFHFQCISDPVTNSVQMEIQILISAHSSNAGSNLKIT